MSHWRHQLQEDLDQLEQAHLLRSLRYCDRCSLVVEQAGRELLNFASNDYLALAGDPIVARRVCRFAEHWGTGAGASRLITGSLVCHREFEHRFAEFKHAESALILPSGYMANLAAITAVAGPDDLVLIDKLNHASLIDAARASGALMRVFGHRDYEKLERLLGKTRVNGRCVRRRLIVTDSVFSMDGDLADLPRLCQLRDRYQAILIVDEAHGTGVLGDAGDGVAGAQGVGGQIDLTVSTASKAMGGTGGIVTGDRLLIQTLINRARSAIYTTAVSPVQVAIMDAALDVIQQQPERRHRLQQIIQQVRESLRASGFDVPADPTPIVPILIGDAAQAVAWSQRLYAMGLWIPAVRPPTVAPGSARLRLTLRSDLTAEHLDKLIECLLQCR